MSELLEVGDFVTYKGLYMAIMAINPKTNKISALCTDNGLMANFEIGDPQAKLFCKGGCKSLIKGIIETMNYKKGMKR